jgi:hypothetical protein
MELGKYKVEAPVMQKALGLRLALSAGSHPTWSDVQQDAALHRACCELAAAVVGNVLKDGQTGTNRGLAARVLNRAGRLLKFATSGSFIPTNPDLAPIRVLDDIIANLTES